MKNQKKKIDKSSSTDSKYIIEGCGEKLEWVPTEKNLKLRYFLVKLAKFNDVELSRWLVENGDRKS